MAKLGVLASGNGSNFEALVLAARAAGHEAVLLICDSPQAFALRRAALLGVPNILVSYVPSVNGDTAPQAGTKAQQLGNKVVRRMAAEARITTALEDAGADLVALAGFIRLLSPEFVSRWEGRLVNIHPALLPAYPGTEAIRRAWDAGESLLGVTVHYVDEGMDTGPILGQVKVARRANFEDTEKAIHEAEHQLYPQIVVSLLDGR